VRDLTEVLGRLLEDEQVAHVGGEWESALKATVVQLLHLVDSAIMLRWPVHNVRPVHTVNVEPWLITLGPRLKRLYGARDRRPWRPVEPRPADPFVDAVTIWGLGGRVTVCTGFGGIDESDPLPGFISWVNELRHEVAWVEMLSTTWPKASTAERGRLRPPSFYGRRIGVAVLISRVCSESPRLFQTRMIFYTLCGIKNVMVHKTIRPPGIVTCRQLWLRQIALAGKSFWLQHKYNGPVVRARFVA